jgi:hypothetical protein
MKRMHAAVNRTAAFLLAIFKYLIETYGLPAFMKLYDSLNFTKACTLILGCTADSLADEWKQYLYEYPDITTLEEIDQALKDIVTQHGYLVAP